MYPVKYIWTILTLKILQAHLLQAFVANLKIDAIYALYPEIFGDIYLAVQEVFAFSDYASKGTCQKRFSGLFCPLRGYPPTVGQEAT